MKKEHYVTLEQAKQLKELGIKQFAECSWFGDEKVFNEEKTDVKKHVWINSTKPSNNQELDHRDDISVTIPIASAYSVAELGEMFYDDLISLPFKDDSGQWFYSYPNPDDDPDRHFDYEAEARADLLIRSIKDEHMIVDHINAFID